MWCDAATSRVVIGAQQIDDNDNEDGKTKKICYLSRNSTKYTHASQLVWKIHCNARKTHG